MPRVRVVVAGVVAAAVVVVGVPVALYAVAYGCGGREERVMDALEAEPVLKVRPEGVGAGRPYRTCDDEFRYMGVGRRYAYGRSWQEAYRVIEPVALRDGWRVASVGDGSLSPRLVKEVGGVTAHLSVDSPDGETLWVAIDADPLG